MTIPGPFTMSQQAQNDFYEDEVEMAMDYARVVNEEAQDYSMLALMLFRLMNLICKPVQT